MARRELSLGRGGVFVRGFESRGELLPIGFEFTFTEGSILRMDGCGISRWQRTVPGPNLPAGMGIEILDIDAQSRRRIADLISSTNTKAFIPKA